MLDYLTSFYGKRNFGADFVRVLAITLVLISHSRRLIPIDDSLSSLLTFGGWIGVELFFVLSGLLVGGLIYRAEFLGLLSKRWVVNFIIRRWFRTIPAYLVVLLFCYYTYRFDFSYLVFFQSFANFESKYLSVFPVSWSLVIEEWFYVFFASSVVFLIHRKVNNIALKSGIYLLFFSVIIQFAFYFSPLIDIYNMGWRYFPFRFTGLALGVILVFILSSPVVRNVLSSNLSKIMLIFSWAFLVYLYYLRVTDLKVIINSSYFYYESFNFIGVLISFFTVAICVSSSMSSRNGNIEKTRSKLFYYMVSHIATLSYSLYLVHMEVFRYIVRGGGYQTYLSLFIYFIASYLLSYFLYKVVEENFMKLRNKITVR